MSRFEDLMLAHHHLQIAILYISHMFQSNTLMHINPIRKHVTWIYNSFSGTSTHTSHFIMQDYTWLIPWYITQNIPIRSNISMSQNFTIHKWNVTKLTSIFRVFPSQVLKRNSQLINDVMCKFLILSSSRKWRAMWNVYIYRNFSTELIFTNSQTLKNYFGYSPEIYPYKKTKQTERLE